jgi:hypothetical protein
MIKLYRNFLMAGVVSLALAACGDDLTITEPTPPPPPPPGPVVPNITTFSVTPGAATIAPGGFIAASATLITKPGVTGSVSWTSSNPAVATLSNESNSGVTITAVSVGSAVITATATADGETANAAIGITVRPLIPAQISIQSVTTANLGTPVNVGNVMGQIEVNMNFDPGEETVDSVAFFIGNTLAASQVYTNGPAPAAGLISLSTNTAHYTKNVAAGTTTVRFPNGPTTISAAVFRAGQPPVATNQVAVVLNNADGWAADLTKPTRSADNGAGITYWGGPGEAGIAEATVYPVIYTPGRSVESVTFRVGRIGFVGCDNITMTTMPFRATFGYGTDGADVDCSGSTGTAYQWTGGAFTPSDNVVIVAALDNQSTPFAAPAPLIANTVVLGSTPDSARFDWQAPSMVAVPDVDGHNSQMWVKADWSFNPGGTLVTDNGVGAVNNTWRSVVSSVGAAGATSVNGDTVSIGGDLPETNTNTTAVDGYRLRGIAHDRLLNSATSAQSDQFGVDVTAPMIRYSVVAAPSNFAAAYVRSVNPATADSASGLAAFVGIYGADAGAAATGDIEDYVAAAAGTNDSTRHDAIDNRSGLYRAHVNTRVFAQGGATGTQSLACTSTAAFNYGAALVDGWRTSPAHHLVCDELTAIPGYYTTSHQAEDAAGNLSAEIYKRTIAFDPGQPQVTGVSPNASYTANQPAIFTIGAQDDLEVIDGSIRINYPNVSIADAGNATAANGLRWKYTAFTPFATRFDASIVNPLIGTMQIDAFTVSIQETDDGSLGGYAGDPWDAPGVVKPDMVGATVRDVYGSSKNNWFPSLVTGVSDELTSPLLSATIPAVGTYSVTYDASTNCPAGGVVGGPCVTSGINFRADGIAGSTYSYRAVQDMSVTLPLFTRVDLFGLNGDDEWEFIQRITVPASVPTNGTIAAGAGTITGSDNSFERYWVYAFTNVPAGYSAYRALGVNAAGHGLFSTVQ